MLTSRFLVPRQGLAGTPLRIWGAELLTTKNTTKRPFSSGNDNKNDQPEIDVYVSSKPFLKSKGNPSESLQTPTAKQSKPTKHKYLVPHVPNIDYISRKEIEVEKLFARDKPLFLGKFPLDLPSDNSSKVKSLGEFLETLQQTTTAEEAKNTQIKIINITENDGSSDSTDGATTTGNIDTILGKLQGSQNQLVKPWEASVTGIAFKEDAWKKVPKTVLETLKPYELKPLNRAEMERQKAANLKKKLGTGGRKRVSNSKRYQFGVYSSRINNGVGYFDLNDIPMFYQPPKISDPFDTLEANQDSKHFSTANQKDNSLAKSSAQSSRGQHVQQQYSYDPETNPTTVAKIRTERKKYIMHLAGEYSFIKEDQSTLRTEIMKLNKFLSKEFEKMRNISIQNEFRNYVLPLYIYVDHSGVSKRRFRSYLKKMIMSHIEPLLETVCAAFEEQKQSDSFRKKVKIKLSNAIRHLRNEIPSIYFTTDGIDCILQKSSVKGFGKIYWLKNSSRQLYIFNRKNADKSYIVGGDQTSYYKRSGLKNMKYPIKLISEQFDDAFKRWEDFI
ncbi:hypothetical protein ACO0QE_000285 [Hanseniaspora vineae]